MLLRVAVAVTVLGTAAVVSAVAPARQDVPRCTTAALQVWLGLGEGGAAAGSTYYPLEFTNVSKTSCKLRGYPVVSALKNGQAVGLPSSNDGSSAVKTVLLNPGETAHAVLKISDVNNFPAAQCKPVTASGMQVTPPSRQTSRTIPFSFSACSGDTDAYLAVSPVESGVGVPGF